MNTVRTTITLDPQILHKLKSFVTRTESTMSQVISLGILRVIDEAEQGRSKKIWSKLKKMKGVGKVSQPSLAKKSVNEVLYGDDGAWRGSNR